MGKEALMTNMCAEGLKPLGMLVPDMIENPRGLLLNGVETPRFRKFSVHTAPRHDMLGGQNTFISSRRSSCILPSCTTAYCANDASDSAPKELLKPWWRSLLHVKWVNLKSRLGRDVVGQRERKRLVVLGTGWAGVTMLPLLDILKYDITVISPRNYFSFTPFLPSVCVGTLSPRACIEPVRNLTIRGGKEAIRYLEASATDIDFDNKVLVCRSEDKGADFQIPYDLLVVSVGATCNFFNTPGAAQNSSVLKDVENANDIKTKVLHNIEKANLPGIVEDEIRRLLHFTVVGAGPTGSETAAELSDFVNSELKKFFPRIAHLAKVTLVEMQARTLPTFSEKASTYCGKNLDKLKVNLLLKHKVTHVTEKSITVQSMDSGVTETLPCGMIVWASGVSPVDFIMTLKKHLAGSQKGGGPLAVDPQMRVLGTQDSSSVYALGDCSRIQTSPMHADKKLVSRLWEESQLFASKASTEFLKSRKNLLSLTYPQMNDYKVTEDIKDMSLEDFTAHLKKVDDSYMAPWASAQFAKQEGQYLAQVLNQFDTVSQRTKAQAFFANWQGSLAYVGDHQAVADFPGGKSLVGGFISILIWKAVYLQMQLSLRTASHVLTDWIRTYLGGRDVVKEQSLHPR